MMAYLFAARAGALDVERVGDLADCFFRISGEIVTTDAGVMEIRMPMDRIDVRVRAAGLDRDPGWVPWLLRRVRVVYES